MEKDSHQWHATLFVGLEAPKPRYPKNAPTATESMTQPLYVMKRSLQIISMRITKAIPVVEQTYMMKKL